MSNLSLVENNQVDNLNRRGYFLSKNVSHIDALKYSKFFKKNINKVCRNYLASSDFN